MPTGNQNQGRRNEPEGRKTNGPKPPVADQTKDVTHQVQAKIGDAAGRLREGYESAGDSLATHYRSAEGAFARNPGSSVLIAFGVGFGVGLALTALMSGREETWADRYVPDSLRDLPESYRKLKIQDRVASATQQGTESIHSTFEQLADSIKDLPAMIAKMVPYR